MNLYSSRTIYAICVLFMLSFSACRKQYPVNQAKSVADADRYYSVLSFEKGRNTAFLAMFDSAGVTLAPHKNPVEGYKAIKKILLSRSDTTYSLTWEPRFAKVADSGELGYTYGTYKLANKATNSLLQEGTYITIWHKNAQGEWKALLDTGNEGLK